MKNVFYIMTIIILIVVGFFLENKNYALIGCIGVIIILSTITFLEVYKYFQNKKELSNISIILKREGIMPQLFYAILFIHNIFRDITNQVYIVSKSVDFVFSTFILLFIVIRLCMTIINTPQLSTNGFLCSDGKFISFSQIKLIECKDKAMSLSKELTVKYDEKYKETFKISYFDYENVEKHLKEYGSFTIKK